MGVITSVLVICTILLTLLYAKTRRPSNYPTGPSALSFIGILYKDIRGLMKVFRRYRMQYGDIFSFSLGRQTFVVVNGADAAHEVFVKNAHSTSDRPKMLFFTRIGKGFGMLHLFLNTQVSSTNIHNNLKILHLHPPPQKKIPKCIHDTSRNVRLFSTILRFFLLCVIVKIIVKVVQTN